MTIFEIFDWLAETFCPETYFEDDEGNGTWARTATTEQLKVLLTTATDSV